MNFVYETNELFTTLRAIVAEELSNPIGTASEAHVRARRLIVKLSLEDLKRKGVSMDAVGYNITSITDTIIANLGITISPTKRRVVYAAIAGDLSYIQSLEGRVAGYIPPFSWVGGMGGPLEGMYGAAGHRRQFGYEDPAMVPSRDMLASILGRLETLETSLRQMQEKPSDEPGTPPAAE